MVESAGPVVLESKVMFTFPKVAFAGSAKLVVLGVPIDVCMPGNASASPSFDSNTPRQPGMTAPLASKPSPSQLHAKAARFDETVPYIQRIVEAGGKEVKK